MGITTAQGEKVLFETRQHWVVMVAPGLLVLLGLLNMRSFGALFLLIGLPWLLLTFIDWNTARYYVTTHRVIANWWEPLLSWKKLDLRVSHINSIDIKTTAFGALLGMFGQGYSTLVVVTSDSANNISVRKVFKASEFKHMFTEAATAFDDGRHHMANKVAGLNAAACPSCGQLQLAGATFCAGCGTKLALTCTGCGASVVGQFCAGCGQPVAAIAAAPQPAVLG